MPDPRREGVVDARVTQCALDPHRAQRPLTIEEARHTDDRVELQQRERDARISEVHSTATQLLQQGTRERIDVHLESDRKRGLRTDTAADAAEAAALDGLVQLECVTPEGFVAEGVEAEGVTAGSERLVSCVAVEYAACIAIFRVGRS